MLKEDLLLLLDLLVIELFNVLHLTRLAANLHVALDLAFLLHEVVLDLEQLSIELVVDVLLLLLKLGKLGWLVGSADDGVDTALAVSCVLAELLLLSNLLFHHGEDFFLELDAFLLVQLEEQIFQLFLMLIINESFEGGGDFLGGQFELHLGDKIIKDLSGHVVLLDLEIVRVGQGLLDALSKLTLLLLALILDSLVAAGSSRGKLVLQGLVLLL